MNLPETNDIKPGVNYATTKQLAFVKEQVFKNTVFFENLQKQLAELSVGVASLTSSLEKFTQLAARVNKLEEVTDPVRIARARVESTIGKLF